MSSLEKNWEELNVTRDEVRNITEALKNEEFRKLLVEYVEETQNPESRKKFQDDIIQLEAERGVDCTFVNPKPGFVIKTSIDGLKKAFINVCSNPLIGKPVSKPMAMENSRGLNWSIPYSQSPGRDDFDKKKHRCIVYDVVFHPDTLHLAQNNAQFKNLVIETAVKGIENTYNVQLDLRNVKLPKLKYKGIPNPTVIRKISKNPVKLTEDDVEFHKNFEFPTAVPEENKQPRIVSFNNADSKEKYTTPHYVIKHRSGIDIQEFTGDKHCKMNAAIPKELVVDINLPLLNSTNDVNLDISERGLELVSDTPIKYKLSIRLPYEVSPNGQAQFDVDKRILTVTLPVLRRSQKPIDFIREDSGVESDAGDHSIHELPSFNEPIINEVKNENLDSFLSDNQHYVLPSYDINREGNSLCFVLNVKNVSPISIKKKNFGQKGFHIKFTSVGAGCFPIHYAFCAKFQSELDDDVNVEVWDNNVTIQVQFDNLESNKPILVGLNEEEVFEKNVEDILDLTSAVDELKLAEEEEEYDHKNPVEIVSVHEDEVVFDVDMCRESSPGNSSEESSQDIPEVLPKLRTYSEGSGDESGSGSLRRSILKNRMSRSLSESCADDAGAGFSGGVLYTWSDSCISERGEGEAKEVKKTVRFSQHIQRQTFRINSSILGQRRKNQKRTRNKKKSLERRLSESENSEEGDEREKWIKRRASKTSEPGKQSVIAEEMEPAKHNDADEETKNDGKENKKVLRKKNTN